MTYKTRHGDSGSSGRKPIGVQAPPLPPQPLCYDLQISAFPASAKGVVKASFAPEGRVWPKFQLGLKSERRGSIR